MKRGDISMKKITAMILAVIMLIGCMAVSVSAKIKEQNAVGAIVYVKYTKEAPNMEPGVIDESWGECIHMDSKSKYCGQWAMRITGDQPETWKVDPAEAQCDFYFAFDDEKIYMCIHTVDVMKLGSYTGWCGDAVCVLMDYNNKDMKYRVTADPRFDINSDFTYHTYGAKVDFDDETVNISSNTVDGSWTDVRDGFVVKWSILWKELGIKPEMLDEGCLYNFCVTRMTCTNPEANGNDGFFYWGKWFDISLAKGASDWSWYVADSPNAKSPNTFIFSKYNEITELSYSYTDPAAGKGGSTTPDTPVTPVTPTEQPSSWAKAEVDKAIAAGLVPAELQANYTKGISRANLSKILSALLDKVYGKAPTKTDAKFKDTTDADVLKAANLGIINGYDAGNGTFNFKPNNTLKRSEMSAIVNRVAKLCGKTTTGYDKEVKFADTANHWCKTELGWPVHVGIVKGTSDTTFSPENTLTTEQTIMMIYRAYEALK